MARTTLTTLSEDHFAMRRRQRFAEKTLRCERSSVGKLCRWWDATRRAPSSLDADAMEQFLYGDDGLADLLPAASSFNTQLAQIRRFVEWLIRRGIVHPGVLDVMKPLKYERREYLQLTLPSLVNMVESTNDALDRFILAFSLQTLGREGELLSRQWSHVNLDAGFITWRRNKTSKTINGRDKLPITADLDREIRRWVLTYQEQVGGPIQDDWYLIPRRAGRYGNWRVDPLQARANVAEIVQRYASRYAPGVDLRDQGAHIMRRSAARALYEQLLAKGEPDPARIVQALLGHASVTTTEIYLDIRKDREKRNDVLLGKAVLSLPTDNVVELKAV